MKPIVSLVMPYYRNPTMLGMQYALWASFPQEVKDLFEIVIVDDGSPDEKARWVDRPAGLPRIRIFEVQEDKPWHQHAARNIGAHEAVGKILLLTDMDHMVTEQLITFCAGVETSQNAWHVKRLEWDTKKPTLDRFDKPKPHPNTFIMSKKLFWKMGGYDEDYCGHYGTDGLFRHRLAKHAKLLVCKEAVIYRLSREMVHDASTRDLKRKEGREEGFRDRITEWKQREGRGIITLSMPYFKVVDG